MLNKQMFENAVLVILTISPGLGSIQVRKALCIADAVHNALYKQSITGVTYIKEKLGPVPDDTGYRCLNEMIYSKKIEIYEEPVGPYTQNSYFAAVEPDYSALSENQIDILKYAAHLAARHTASDLSFKTHDAVYDSIGMRQEIPLSAICSLVVTGYDTEPFTDEERDSIKEFLKSDENRLFALG